MRNTLKVFVLSSLLTLGTVGIASAQSIGYGGGGGNGPVSGSYGGYSFGGSIVPTTVSTPTSAPVGKVLGAEAFNFKTNLRLGSHVSPDVTELQKVLIAGGYLKIDAPTGYFGKSTFAAVKLYQAANKVSATGFVGPATRAILNQGSTPTTPTTSTSATTSTSTKTN